MELSVVILARRVSMSMFVGTSEGVGESCSAVGDGAGGKFYISWSA